MSAEELATDLGAALTRFEWKRAEALCGELVVLVREMSAAPPATVPRALSALRRKRRYTCMVQLAEALIRGGYGTAFVRRQYAQALIDQGALTAAQLVLRDAMAQTLLPQAEAFELQGLLGRVLKQWYVTIPEGAGAQRRETLQGAIDAYLAPYIASPARNYWHGINVVALLERGLRDHVDVTAGQASSEIAAAILSALDAAEQERPEPPSAWEVATRMEALLALGRIDAALQCAREYAAHPDADAFEAASTLRQLTEVWNLSDSTPPGSAILPLLKAKILLEAGGELTFETKDIAKEQQRVARLELVHGFDRFQTLQWYRQGLECCGAVARIETETGRGIGTGWFSRGGDWPERLRQLRQVDVDAALLVTNAHVVSPADRPFPGALPPGDVIVNFQVAGVKARVGDIVWSSPVEQLDCTVLRMTTPPALQPLRFATQPVRYRTPPPRLYIIGHPGGRDVEFSLQDNHLLGCSDRLLHYRTPTEGGSSGSPVFDDAWRVVALHHAGDNKLARLDGEPGTYEANEGIAVTALLQASGG